MRLARAPLPVALAILLAACGASTPSPTPPDGPDDGEPMLVIVDGDPSGSGISVADAIGHQPMDDIVVVAGALVVSPDGSVRICDALAESFPPQCAGASMAVEGLDLATIEDLQNEGDVSWAEGVLLLGSVE
jgi:hypothetical protein